MTATTLTALCVIAAYALTIAAAIYLTGDTPL